MRTPLGVETGPVPRKVGLDSGAPGDRLARFVAAAAAPSAPPGHRRRPAGGPHAALDRPGRHERPHRRDRRRSSRIPTSSTSAPPPAACGSRSTAASPGSRSSTTSRSPRSAPIAIVPAATRRSSGSAPARATCATARRSATASTGRSTAAETWTHLGLDGSERIHRIVLHPERPRHRLGGGARPRVGRERRARRLQDRPTAARPGARSCTSTSSTGGADLVDGPGNPNKLFAAMWQFRRWPYFFRSGGPGSGLYARSDGGETWKRCEEEDGLPEGDARPHRARICRARPGDRLRAGRGGEERPVALRRRRPQLQDGERRAQRHAAAVLLRRPARRPAGPEPRLQPRLHGARLDDGGKTFAHARPLGRDPRRPSRHVDRSARIRAT